MYNDVINKENLKKEEKYISYERNREIISLFQKNKVQFKDLEYGARNNKTIALYAYRIDSNNIKYIGYDLKKDVEFIKKAIKDNYNELLKIKKYLDPGIIYDLVAFDISFLKFVSIKKLENKTEMLKFIKYNYKSFNSIPDKFKNIEFIKEAIKSNYKIYLNFSETNRKNKELLKMALEEIDFLREDDSFYLAIPNEFKKSDLEIKQILNKKIDEAYF